jgi:hypothetical protein
VQRRQGRIQHREHAYLSREPELIEKFFGRVALRISRTVFSALSGTRLLACLIVAPQRGYDEPGILSYAISSFCPTSADGLQLCDIFVQCRLQIDGINGEHFHVLLARHKDHSRETVIHGK